MKKIGRPKSNNPRNIRLEITLNKNEDIKLKKISENKKSSRTSILIKGLKLFENIENSRNVLFKSVLPEEIKKGGKKIMERFDSVGTLAKLTNKDPKIVQQELIDSGLPKKIMEKFIKCYNDQVEVEHTYEGINFSVICTVTYDFQVRDEIHWTIHYDKIKI